MDQSGESEVPAPMKPVREGRLVHAADFFRVP